ncbi:MAG: acyl-ACP--UDP-N-acetylglucosamine O-acyltransferase [Phycisphaeraceae bacterium]|nr:acyl-ACP--UDP-N-acetylglucosamine O-acyltransferase [Phycisphaeraceae bacterium]
MPHIHPTASVDPRAKLAEDVSIGPNCTIDGPAVIGPGTRLIANVYLHGPVTLGRDNILYPNVCLGFPPQDRKFNPQSPTAGVEIGDRNQLRESVTIHAASQAEHPTRLGCDNLMMTSAHIGHDAVVGSHCILASNSLVGGHAVIADQVNLGGAAAVHQICRLGRLCFLGGLSGATKDVPPFAMCSGINNLMGINVVGLRRAGTPRPAIDHVRAAFETLFLEQHTIPVATDLIADRAQELARDGQPEAHDLLLELVEFIRNSRRGLIPHASVNQRHRLQR